MVCTNDCKTAIEKRRQPIVAFNADKFTWRVYVGHRDVPPGLHWLYIIQPTDSGTDVTQAALCN